MVSGLGGSPWPIPFFVITDYQRGTGMLSQNQYTDQTPPQTYQEVPAPRANTGPATTGLQETGLIATSIGGISTISILLWIGFRLGGITSSLEHVVNALQSLTERIDRKV